MASRRAPGGDDESGNLPRVLAAPALGDSNVCRPVSIAPTSVVKPQVVGARAGDVERHARCRARGDLDVARAVENFGDPVVRIGDVPVETST